MQHFPSREPLLVAAYHLPVLQDRDANPLPIHATLVCLRDETGLSRDKVIGNV